MAKRRKGTSEFKAEGVPEVRKITIITIQINSY